MLTILLAALVGGVILNIMPCVLPVLALKAFTVVEHAKHDDRKRRLHGFFYTAGTMSAFLALGTLVVIGKGAGKHLGWGMQFQHPPFVAAMIAVVFVFALNALGVFEILVSAQGEGDNDKLWGSFMNGIFASILSTPCSAPFVGSAAAFAFGSKTSTFETLLVFAVMGFGLALPYLLLTLIPALANVLPRPGAWMLDVKIVMGFFLLATAIWLLFSFAKQVTPDSLVKFLFFLLALAVALWAGHRFGGIDRTRARRWIVRGLAGAFVFGAFKLTVHLEPAAQAKIGPEPLAKAGEIIPPVIVDGHIVWAPYDAARMKNELEHNRPVFLDFTAEWCATCKANEQAFVETDAVRQAFERTKVLPMKVDMTSASDELDELLDKTLAEHPDRNGIPVYVVKFPGGEQDLLPLVISSELVSGRLDEAAKKFPPDKFAFTPPDPPLGGRRAMR